MAQHDIRVGMTVRDAAGNALGTVRKLYPWGFEAGRRLWSPYQWVFRHDEVTHVGDGLVDVARRQDDLMKLATGGLPESWGGHSSRVGGRPIPAAPAEAREMEALLADREPEGLDDRMDFGDLDLEEGEEREYVRTRGQRGPDAHPHG